MNVSVRPPFDFELSIGFLGGFTPCSGDHRCQRGRLTTAGFADEQPFVAQITAPDADSDDANTLAVEVEWVDEPGEEAVVASWLTDFLSLDDDVSSLYDAANSDDAFERIVDDLYGFHHVRFTTPFEAACWAALSQRTPMQLAKQQKRDMVATAGRIVERNGHEHLLFPTPDLVRTHSTAIENAIGNDRKAKTVLAAADAFVEDDLSALDDNTLIGRLQDIWGFGEWSSEFVFLRGFGRLSQIPAKERRLRTAVADVYALNTDAASDEQLVRLSERYTPMQGYWAYYLRVWAFQRDQAADA